MPSSMPRPARRMGTTRGRGSARRTPTVVVTGVSISCGSTRTSRVASYARSVTSSSTRSRNVEDVVSLFRRTVSLWATSGWSATQAHGDNGIGPRAVCRTGR